MNSRKMYRITLGNDYSHLTQTLVLTAARSNGGKYKPLNELISIAETMLLVNDGYVVEPIGNTLLHIDKKEGDKYINVLILEEVEILEMEEMPQVSAQDARDILDELSPTLNRYAGTGIDNPNFDENLN